MDTQVNIPGVGTVKLPSYATEKTLLDILKLMGEFAKKEGLDEIVDTVDDLTGAINEGRRAEEELDDTLTQMSGQLGGFMDQLSHYSERFISAAKTAYSFSSSVFSVLIGAGTAAIGFMTGTAAFVKDSLEDLYATFGELNKVGLNLAQGFGEDLSQGTRSVVRDFLTMGVGMKELTAMMSNNSFAMAANRRTVMTTVKAFKSLSDEGKDFGMTIGQSTEMLMDELDFRSKLVYQGKVDGDLQAKQAEELFTSQMGFTKLLGKSIEDIRKSAQNILSESSSAVSLVMLQGKKGAETLNGLTTFASGLVASGFTDDFTAALMEAGTEIDMFASESTRQAFTTLQAAGVDIYGTMSKFREMTQSGQLDVEEAGKQVGIFRDQLANMSDQGVDQLRLMAAGGDASAKQMLTMVNQARQAKKSAEELAKKYGDQETTGEDIMKKMLAIDNAWAKIGGTLTDFKQTISMSLLPIFEYVSEILANQDILNAVKDAGDAISEAFQGIMDGMGGQEGVIKEVASFIRLAGETVAGWIKTLREFFGDMKSDMEGGGGLTGVGEKIAGSLLSGMVSAITSFEFLATLAGAFLVMGVGAAALGTAVEKLATPNVRSGAVNMGIIAASIWLVSKAVENFADLSFGGFLQGVVAVGLFVTVGLKAMAAGLNAMTNPKALLGSAALLVTAFAINVIADAFVKFSNASILDGIGAIVGIAAAVGLLGAVMMSGVGAAAIGLGIVALGGIGLALQMFPFQALSNLLTSLTMFSEVEPGSFKDAAEGLGDLITVLAKLSSIAAPGILNNIKSFFGFETESPITRLVDDLTRLSSVDIDSDLDFESMAKFADSMKMFASVAPGAISQKASEIELLAEAIYKLSDAIDDTTSGGFLGLGIKTPFDFISDTIKSTADIFASVPKTILGELGISPAAQRPATMVESRDMPLFPSFSPAATSAPATSASSAVSEGLLEDILNEMRKNTTEMIKIRKLTENNTA